MLADDFGPCDTTSRSFSRRSPSARRISGRSTCPRTSAKTPPRRTPDACNWRPSRSGFLPPRPRFEAEIKHRRRHSPLSDKRPTAAVKRLTKAEAKTAGAKKAADDASEAVAKRRPRRPKSGRGEVARRSRLQNARSGGPPSRRKELAEAAAKFQARAAAIPAEIKQLTATAVRQMETAKSTARALEAAQKESCRVAARFAEANAQAAPAARRLEEAVARHHDHLTRLNSLKLAIAAAKSVEDYAAASVAADAVRRAKSHRDAAQQIVAIRAPLVPAREDELALFGGPLSKDEAVAADVQRGLKNSVAELDAARRDLSARRHRTRRRGDSRESRACRGCCRVGGRIAALVEPQRRRPFAASFPDNSPGT